MSLTVPAHDAPVLIVGGGPVGLVAAIDLAWRGINVIVAETRYANEPPTVKCNHVSSRSMEFFRRLGLSTKIRSAGLPSDYPNDIVFCTTVVGTEFGRVKIPSVEGRAAPPSPEYADSDWPTPEPPHRINQLYLEPILYERAASDPRIKILNRTKVIDIEQTDGRVIATVEDLETLEQRRITALYAIGCDGARSLVRNRIGAKFHGLAEISRNLSSFIRAPSLQALIGKSRPYAWMNHAINPRRSGNAIAIDGKELWLIHCRVKATEGDLATIDRDRAIRDVLGVDETFQYELLSKEDWFGRRLVSDRMRDRRLFLCGDAAHIWIPLAGYGMNCGIADAIGLTWQLAAVLKGWAPEILLNAFEAERHPITEQVSHFVADLGVEFIPKQLEPPPQIADQGPEGDNVRRTFGRELCEMNLPQFCCAGLNFGYYYDNSPITAYDGARPPSYTMGSFTPSTVPGCRLPHSWLADGRSLYDVLGPDYTVIKLKSDIDTTTLEQVASSKNFPLVSREISLSEDHFEYEFPLLIVRPDQHIAWRGHSIPTDAHQLIELLRGERRVSQ